MKRRQGFVSNSSSSSFIINIVKVTDEEKFLENAARYGVTEDNYDLTIIRGVVDYCENHQGGWDTPFDGGDYAGSYFSESQALDIWKDDHEAILAVYEECGGDDSDFVVYDSNGDYSHTDYDQVDLDWFDSFSQHLYGNTNEEEGFENIYSHYGAGRNG